jgi:pimeloyl-ACP methyl ester carboxylesterase
LRPLIEPADLSAAVVDETPRGYLLTRQDRALPPERQRFFAARRPGVIVAEIDGGHSPFLARPAAFVDVLCWLETRIAARNSSVPSS